MKTASLAQAGSLTLAYCHEIPSGDGDVFGVTLRSYSAKNGVLVAERSIVLPAEVEPQTVCESESTRSLATSGFNKDFSLMAGITDAGATGRAAVYDLTTGEEVSPPDPDTFSERAENKGVAFHPVSGLLWYDEKRAHGDKDGLGHRDPKAGYRSEQRLSPDAAADAVTRDAVTAATALAADSWPHAVTPNGKVAADLSGSVDTGPVLTLRRLTADAVSGVGYTLTDLKGADGKETCEPAFWRDETTLVCDLEQITFAPDYSSVVKKEDLVPANDRSNMTPVPSPDGKHYAFLSGGEGGKLTLYQGDLSTPGTQPVKIADLEPPVDGSSDHLETLIRWN
ncbi:hypothetical protein PUR59_05355 [Streptomyces sp. SP18ES09]|uniref:hypothetical protein n=1 Tax=Streptomyces sp. SP18ES09 TaxID=3002532 RepID=UPI002E767A89|nr:hypothetical protein [Streptomyces sp. SP18ES09]MEE1814449.1 hypothetical protein [Streptomyces sp. SP18ES09]